MTSKKQAVEDAFVIAKERYKELGVDVDAAIKAADETPISLHCWQGDDVAGFENPDGELSGGIQVTGCHPGKATNPAELRADLDFAMSLIPGKQRLNLHALYLESDQYVDRDQLEPKHFANWVKWAKAKGIGLDFNPSLFSHEKSAQGMTLSHPDAEIREFWIEHCKRSRKVSEYFGRELGTPSVMNIWIPDGSKDFPADRLGPRRRLMESLDEILKEDISREFHKDAVESKLFGIGAEAYTAGSSEFYLAYAATRNLLLCLDAGHFHPTEVISDKISAVSLFVDEMLLHVSRPMRWDSDHIVLLDDETQAIASEIVRCGLGQRVNIGLDFFDASVNRIGAWVIGTRNMRKALLKAFLEPTKLLKDAELSGNNTKRLALMEDLKVMPWSAVWDYYCQQNGMSGGIEWLDKVETYEKDVLLKRG
ncbi:L-rhamnose isomerase [Pseudovibrio sp. Tun.PSC04-5.I4]|uniref:L-rhamnose isomerase n=1 Tax=Pseudovibrio sp. Tun.PSC04-5.I4 TaxID=1798213 RepID=UPI000886CCFE|nr:L-rhamnose isomerase [Pseudovibrio sp. Tun.PSC04-5.I4]SDQ12987.1 L-rhamnose isomerase [Pseudovibrio sp. Tun.PSC04-5.I4]